MKTAPSITPRTLAISSVFAVLVPIAFWTLWIYVFNQFDNPADRVDLYHSFLPTFMHGRWTSGFMSLGFSLLALIWSSMSLKKLGLIWNIISFLILIASTGLFLLNLFSLM